MNTFTIVTPVYNEEKNIINFLNELFKNIKAYNNYEIIMVNDGSSDNSEKVIDDYIAKNKLKNTQQLKLKKNYGQSYAIYKGIEESKNETIITIDSDLQNDPKDISKLLKIYEETDYDLVSGIRNIRKDNIIKKMSSYIANKIRSFYLRDGCIDTGCSLKIFKKTIFLNFPYFDGIHRFIPALFNGYGCSVTYVNVNHRYRIHGNSKYGISNRLFNNIKNMFLVKKIISKKQK